MGVYFTPDAFNSDEPHVASEHYIDQRGRNTETGRRRGTWHLAD